VLEDIFAFTFCEQLVLLPCHPSFGNDCTVHPSPLNSLRIAQTPDIFSLPNSFPSSFDMT
jgi:hypothetical protein